MTKEKACKENLLSSLREVSQVLLNLLEKFNHEVINTIPFKDSWTAAQIADHITKSNRSITKALLLKGTTINREGNERVEELKAVFLNFTTKFKSPDFILPEAGNYEKEIVIANLAHSVRKIKEAAEKEDLSSMIYHPAFGDITKFEILHFVLFHTQRHIHQLENIYKTITKNKTKN